MLLLLVLPIRLSTPTFVSLPPLDIWHMSVLRRRISTPRVSPLSRTVAVFRFYCRTCFAQKHTCSVFSCGTTGLSGPDPSHGGRGREGRLFQAARGRGPPKVVQPPPQARNSRGENISTVQGGLVDCNYWRILFFVCTGVTFLTIVFVSRGQGELSGIYTS